MSFVAQDVTALDEAYKAGHQQVRTADGRTLVLRSVAEYRQLRQLMQDDIAATAGTTAGSRFVRGGHSSGVV